MAEYIDIRPPWKRETCFHNQGGSCSPSIWCDPCESYRSVYVKLNKADVAPVVRCKDCRYFTEAKVNEKGFLICPASGMEITDNDYCSYGERKDGDG